MNFSLTFLETDGSGEAALRLTPSDSETRVNTHFIMMLDISESMSDANKLGNVKHCMSLLLQFLATGDELTIVTFGETSAVVLRRLRMNAPAATATAEQIIKGLHVEGCTNMSAGLASVREVLDEVYAPGEQARLKQGLFLLTDGHANRGICDPTALRGLVSSVHERYPDLTMSFVAYGVDHNTDLLKGMAQDCVGAYSVVESTEDAALAMGESLGSVTSCVAQNVIVQCPVGSTIVGPYKVTPTGEIRIGDLYAGTEVLLLVNLKEGPVRVRGAYMPSMDPFNQEVTDRSLIVTRNLDIEVTRLRYKCSALWERVRGSDDSAALRAEVEGLRDILADSALDGNAVAEMLRAEIPSLLTAIEERGGRGAAAARLNVLASQHAAWTSLGRGTSQPITQQALYGGGIYNYNNYYAATGAGTDDEDDAGDPDVSGAPVAREASYLSPTTSLPARRVAMAMRVSSSSAAPPPTAAPRVRFAAPSPASSVPAMPPGSPPGTPSPLARMAAAPAPLARASSMPN
jgi:Mg-chelatase subunit ChlD